MRLFVFQVRTGSEESFLKAACRVFPDSWGVFHWPRRKLRLRRGGRWVDSVASIFPGYLFLETERVIPEHYLRLSGVPGFLRFLASNDNILPLSPEDQEIVRHFLSFGSVVGTSRVLFDEDKRITVLAGPLKGLEGRIVKVDRRKGRAKVRLDMFRDSFLVDFGFENLERSGEGS